MPHDYDYDYDYGYDHHNDNDYGYDHGCDITYVLRLSMSLILHVQITIIYYVSSNTYHESLII